ncbi:MAG: 3-phosphoshikimate 1-carboxyvinyltransferase [Clostridia bacterium]|nr:3-phosphoshikimate 1-carboxyvinyltransferase [Clostridia bacterium]
MKATLSPAALHGRIPAIASKSDVHRLLFCAAQANGTTRIRLNGTPVLSDDLLATVDCVRKLGCQTEFADGSLIIAPTGKRIREPHFDCRESGSTLRFLLPVAAARTKDPSFTGSGRLPERPVTDLLRCLQARGIEVSSRQLPFSFSGRLHSGKFELPGDVSSQYITGLMLALPNLHGDSRIMLTSPLQSASYVDITLHALSRFQIEVTPLQEGWHLPGQQIFETPGTLTADGDWSNAGFFLAAGALSEDPDGLTVEGLDPESPQGDRATLAILERFGAGVTLSDSRFEGMKDIKVRPGSLKGTTVDLTDIPDSLPVLAVVASHATGKTIFTGGSRLRLKESDRIHSVAEMIRSLGGQAEELSDGLIVSGKDVAPLTGGTVDSFHDHRIVMAASIAAAGTKEPVTILDCEAVNKSYPTFFEDYQQTGGIAHVV